jgi:hypothetical protein
MIEVRRIQIHVGKLAMNLKQSEQHPLAEGLIAAQL